MWDTVGGVGCSRSFKFKGGIVFHRGRSFSREVNIWETGDGSGCTSVNFTGDSL